MIISESFGNVARFWTMSTCFATTLMKLHRKSRVIHGNLASMATVRATLLFFHILYFLCSISTFCYFQLSDPMFSIFISLFSNRSSSQNVVTAWLQPRYSRDSGRFRTCSSSPDDPFSPVGLLFQLPTSLNLRPLSVTFLETRKSFAEGLIGRALRQAPHEDLSSALRMARDEYRSRSGQLVDQIWLWNNLY